MLEDAFSTIHLLDTNPFMKAAYRQRLLKDEKRITSTRSFTLIDQPLEDLLQANVNTSLR